MVCDVPGACRAVTALKDLFLRGLAGDNVVRSLRNLDVAHFFGQNFPDTELWNVSVVGLHFTCFHVGMRMRIGHDGNM